MLSSPGVKRTRNHWLLLCLSGAFAICATGCNGHSSRNGKAVAGRELTAKSIAPSKLPEDEIRTLIANLRGDGWSTPLSMSIPTHWEFNFTEPMLKLLQAGPSAQPILLQYLNDPQIKDHVIILLGGLGDERSIEPIIQAMPDKAEGPEQKRLNLIANLALTNITVSDVIWYQGGGIPTTNCPDNPKSCWAAWWLHNKNTFKVTEVPSRRYSNYPNYGIYEQR